MAKYSRSALSMKESLAELNEQKAEKFLNTFYFQYGHRSIADLAHIAMAIERLSLLAATIVVDEQRWDGQERSTRYQDFKKSGYYTPAWAMRGTGSATIARPSTPVRRIPRTSELNVSVSVLAGTPTGGDEAGRIRAHSASPGLRYFAISAAAGYEHFAWTDREFAHAGDAGFAPVHGHSCRSATSLRDC